MRVLSCSVVATGSLVLGIILAAAGSVRAASGPSFTELLANLKSPNARTRQEAVSELGKSRRRESVSALSALVRDSEVKVRLEVVRAFRAIRDLSATPALVTQLEDGDTQVREETIGALVELYAEREGTGTVEGFLQVFADEFDRNSLPTIAVVEPSVIQGLSKRLRDTEVAIRREAAFALGILDGKAALPALKATLQDPEPSVRGAAVTSIGKIGSSSDGPPLIPYLEDSSLEVRNRTLSALGVLRTTEAAPALRQLFESNRRKEVGVRALACLSRIGDPAQADLFRELVQDPDPERRRLAVEGLGRLADPSMTPAFKKDFQRERSDDLRLSYAFALTLLGDRAFLDTIVLALPSRLYGQRARNYILEMGRDIGADLLPYLNDPDAEIRAILCDLLAALGATEAIGRLTPLLSDPSRTVVDRANLAIERLKRVSSQPGGR